MENRQNISKQTSHSGGDARFWQDERVQKYEYQQSLLSEKKGDVLTNIARIVNYFCKLYSITSPKMLDIGCGPGTPMTLSSYILEKVPNSTVIGVDSSDQMIEAARGNLNPKYGQRFSGFVSDFNSSSFWINLPNSFDFVISSGALHYLSDAKRIPFLVESYNHLKNQGVFVAGIGTSSFVPEIGEMEQIFRAEYTYNELEHRKRPNSFSDFRRSFQEVDNKANINWTSPSAWLDAFREAGFKVDIVWHLWVRSIFLGIK